MRLRLFRVAVWLASATAASSAEQTVEIAGVSVTVWSAGTNVSRPED